MASKVTPTTKVIPTSKLASTSALILAVLSLVAFSTAALGLFLNWGWVDDSGWAWFLLPGIAFGCGTMALYLGIVGVREARREPEGEGFGRSVFGSIAGGLVTLILLGCVAAVIAAFIFIVIAYPQG